MNDFDFSYVLCSTENNLDYFLEQEHKTGLIKNSSFRFLIVEPSSRVELRYRKFLQTLDQIIQCLQWYFRKFNQCSWAIIVAATPEGTSASVAKKKNGQFDSLALRKTRENIVARLLMSNNWFYFSNNCLMMPKVKNSKKVLYNMLLICVI